MAMTFDELVAEVVSRTGRPDKQEEIKSYVIEATLNLHYEQDYRYDVASVDYAVPSPGTTVDILKSVMADFRKIDSITKLDASIPAVEYGNPLRLVDAFSDRDENGILASDTYKDVGASILLYSYTGFAKVRLRYYKLPLIGRTNATYNSWIALTNPFLIVNKAVQLTHRRTGNAEIARSMEPEIQEQLRLFKFSFS